MILAGTSQGSSEYYYEEEDSQFLEALNNAVLPGDQPLISAQQQTIQKDNASIKDDDDEDLELPPPAQQSLKRRHSSVVPDSEDEQDVQEMPKDDTYDAYKFGGFGDYMRRKRAKLQIQNAEMVEGGQSVAEDRLFQGLAIYINGFTRPSVQELRHLIVKHGGVFHPYLDRKALVTHIITCSLTPAKIREFKHMKVVRPEWLMESIKQGVLLPWKDFQYVHDQRIETSQGIKAKQPSLTDLTQEPEAPSSAQPRTSFLQPKKPIPDPLYVTDPATKADAARVPGYAADKSNPNAQRVMANPEWRKANTSASSNFIEGYYKNSRLHHLATWKAELLELVQEAQDRAEAGGGVGHAGKIKSEAQTAKEHDVSMRGAMLRSPSKWKGKGKAAPDEDRVIMHCDFDCFFVSAGLISRPHLKGKPVVVCHSQGNQGGASSTSEIASSSYEARSFGIKNGMSLQQARQLCPEVVTIPYEFERYKEFSLKFYTVLMAHAEDLQAVSVDEALIDVTTAVNELKERSDFGDPAKDYAEQIRAEIRNVTSCEISIGISHNILLARLATRRAKPGGSYHLFQDDVQEFLAPLQITDLHGFGWSMKQKAIEKLGTAQLGDLFSRSKGVLIDALGKATGENLYKALRGIDDRKLESHKPRKSVSCEISYGIRFENNEQAKNFIFQMATEVKKRLDAINMVGKSITLKIMKRDPTAPVEAPKFLGHGACDLFNKQMPLQGPTGRATSDENLIGEHAWRMLKSFNFDPKELRGIGIQVQKLESSSSAASSTSSGQAVLPFKPNAQGPPPGKATTSKATLPERPPAQPPITTTRQPTKAEPTLDLPSFSQVDRSVFDALPPEIRAELESEYKRRSESPAPPVQPGHMPKNPISRQASERRSVPPQIFPDKPKAKPNYGRIAQQLAPRSRPSVSPTKAAIYAWAKPKPKKPTVRITDAALRALDLDPEVFNALPVKVQREQLVRARLIRDRGRLPTPPSERKVIKPAKIVFPPGFVVYRAPKPRAKHIQPPSLKQYGKNKEKLVFTETGDIQNILETWLMTFRHWKPRAKDVEYLSKYLVQSVDGKEYTDVSVERAIQVMRWWLLLMRRLWPAYEVLDEDDLDSSQRDPVGEAWWDTFYDVKEKMDEVVRKRFGSGISLK
ncbi:hypothetical protein CVT24_005975 [Panaeolus cyanescens]|uniref:DNA repair protein REV1 n=1 Tax=Panaeolus cyanescens TaxID=181874 RepID=A0A409VAX8_9AGAR|nr:hypothetical protein CVT24_005975 [Panaeolus cyanescens]